jgi:hypothetical protein
MKDMELNEKRARKQQCYRICNTLTASEGERRHVALCCIHRLEHMTLKHRRDKIRTLIKARTYSVIYLNFLSSYGCDS